MLSQRVHSGRSLTPLLWHVNSMSDASLFRSGFALPFLSNTPTSACESITNLTLVQTLLGAANSATRICSWRRRPANSLRVDEVPISRAGSGNTLHLSTQLALSCHPPVPSSPVSTMRTASGIWSAKSAPLNESIASGRKFRACRASGENLTCCDGGARLSIIAYNRRTQNMI